MNLKGNHSIYNVLIVGAGNIAAGYDRPGQLEYLTHTHAVCGSPYFNLSGFIDVCAKKANKAVSKWGGQSYCSLRDAFKNKIDIVAITVPDQFHYELLVEVTSFPVKLVFTEKPLAADVKGGLDIVSLYEKRNIPLCVNYKRRYAPEMSELKKHIQQKLYGNFLTGSGCYGKGLVHNGSHLVDLLFFLLGEVTPISATYGFVDFTEEDPTASASLLVKNRPFWMIGIDSNYCTVFELDLFFEKARIRVKDLGNCIEVSTMEESRVHKGYKVLGPPSQAHVSLDHSMKYSYENIFHFLEGNETLKCTGRDALDSLEICLELKGKLK